jgi:predicted naringenin-chalcone synthase
MTHVRDGARDVYVLGIGTAAPTGILPAKRAAEISAQLTATTPREANRVHSAVRLCRVAERHSVLAVGSDEVDLPFFTQRPATDPGPPGTADRMRVFAQEAPRLAAQAASEAITLAGVAKESITHVITATCTGFFAPGPDIQLIELLGLSPQVARTHIGFMGCHAALNACATARAIARADADAFVLVVCVELCTIHFQQGLDRDSIVPNSLFGDGSGAVVFSASAPETHAAPARMLGSASYIFPNTANAMSWTITDHGFRMTLATETPDFIRTGLRAPVEAFLAKHDLAISDIADWAIHPGGPRVIESALAALTLDPSQSDASREILRNYGNMSSPTVLFIINELAARGVRGPVVALAFGPGLVAEMMLLHFA